MSIMSPIRTTSPETATLARSTGMAITSSPALGQCRHGGGREQGGCEQNGANEHGQLPHRNSAEVVCSIWSAALITLAFIS